MDDHRHDTQKERMRKSAHPHEAVLLSKIIAERLTIRINFLDGEILIDGLRWHTPYHLGMRQGKVVSKSAIKYWEIIEN